MSLKQMRAIDSVCGGETSSAHQKRWLTHHGKATLSAADFRVCKGQKQARECLASGNARERYSGS